MPVGEGWQLLSIRGIPLRIHPSWFIILALATLAFADQYRGSFGGSASNEAVWLIAFLTALLLFVSVLLHEMGHSLVALSQGVQVRSITLFLLGGVASVERECSTALGALAVAAAGPAVSLLLAGLLLGGSHAAYHLSPLLGGMVTQLGTLNLVLLGIGMSASNPRRPNNWNLLVALLGFDQKLAAGTSLAVMVPIALLGALRLSRPGLTQWSVGVRIGLGGIVGGVLGAQLALRLPTDVLAVAFAVLLVIVAARMMWAGLRAPRDPLDSPV